MSLHAIELAFKYDARTPAAKLVLLALANYANANGKCWAAQKVLAKDTGLAERSIRNGLAMLKAEGAIQCEARQRKDGSRTTDMITILFVQDVPSPRQSEPSQAATGAEVEAPVAALASLEPKLIQKSEAKASSEPFDRFWSAYPNKVAKPTARKAFTQALRKIGGSDPVSKLLEAIERSKRSERWRRNYIPNPSTWLNQERWTDEPSERSDCATNGAAATQIVDRRASTEARRNAWTRIASEGGRTSGSPDDDFG